MAVLFDDWSTHRPASAPPLAVAPPAVSSAAAAAAARATAAQSAAARTGGSTGASAGACRRSGRRRRQCTHHLRLLRSHMHVCSTVLFLCTCRLQSVKAARIANAGGLPMAAVARQLSFCGTAACTQPGCRSPAGTQCCRESPGSPARRRAPADWPTRARSSTDHRAALRASPWCAAS